MTRMARLPDLAGITVVSVEQAVAAPYASVKLAEAGARVIKVERPEGDFARGYDRHVLGQSAYFVWLNRGKESVRIDLASQGDICLLGRLIDGADVFIQNLKPDTLTKFGVGAAQCRARNDRLITCDISGFGSAGPLSARKAYDLIVQAEIGLCAITGGPDMPARAGISICDIAAGAAAHAAILQALYARERTGRGRRIEISLFDAIAEWMNVPILQYLYGGATPLPMGVSHPTIAPYGAFRCADGQSIVLAVQNEREWRLLCRELLGQPELAEDARFSSNSTRVLNRPALDALVAGRIGAMSTVEVEECLLRSDIAFGRLNGLAEACRHPQLRFAKAATDQGDVDIVAPASIVDGMPPEHLGTVPRLGRDDARHRRA